MLIATAVKMDSDVDDDGARRLEHFSRTIGNAAESLGKCLDNSQGITPNVRSQLTNVISTSKAVLDSLEDLRTRIGSKTVSQADLDTQLEQQRVEYERQLAQQRKDLEKKDSELQTAQQRNGALISEAAQAKQAKTDAEIDLEELQGQYHAKTTEVQWNTDATSELTRVRKEMADMKRTYEAQLRTVRKFITPLAGHPISWPPPEFDLFHSISQPLHHTSSSLCLTIILSI